MGAKTWLNVIAKNLMKRDTMTAPKLNDIQKLKMENFQIRQGCGDCIFRKQILSMSRTGYD